MSEEGAADPDCRLQAAAVAARQLGWKGSAPEPDEVADVLAGPGAQLDEQLTRREREVLRGRHQPPDRE